MHHAEAVIRRVPQLADTAQAASTRRHLAHERGSPALGDEPIARRIARVVGQARGLVVTAGAVRAAVVRMALRRLGETLVGRNRRRTDGEAHLVVEQKHVGVRDDVGVGARCERQSHERQARRKADKRGQQGCAREIPPHLN